MPPIQQVTNSLKNGFLSQPNIVGISHQNGRIVIQVVGQKEAQRINQQLGGTAGGYPLEVQVVPTHPSFQSTPNGASLEESPSPGRGKYIRPVVGGTATSVGVNGAAKGWWGTLTGIWKDRDTGGLLIVSNRHVYETMSTPGIPKGADILQPHPITSGKPYRDLIVAKLDRWSHFTTGQGTPSGSNQPKSLPVDVAAGTYTASGAESVSQILASQQPQRLLKVQSWRDPKPGETVIKFGARSGATKGQILSADGATKMGAESGSQVVIDHSFRMSCDSGAGDSGSPVLTTDGTLVGQLFGGSGGPGTGPSWANVISYVNDTLNADPVAITAPTTPPSPTTTSPTPTGSGTAQRSPAEYAAIAGLTIPIVGIPLAVLAKYTRKKH